MLLIGCGKQYDARMPSLRKDAVGDGLRFQAAGRGFGSAVQALGFDKVKLRSCPNVRPDTEVTEVRLRSCPNVRPDTEVTVTPKLPELDLLME
jgi:hypothetical protein